MKSCWWPAHCWCSLVSCFSPTAVPTPSSLKHQPTPTKQTLSTSASSSTSSKPDYRQRKKPPGPSTRQLENRVWARNELKAVLPIDFRVPGTADLRGSDRMSAANPNYWVRKNRRDRRPAPRKQGLGEERAQTRTTPIQLPIQRRRRGTGGSRRNWDWGGLVAPVRHCG